MTRSLPLLSVIGVTFFYLNRLVAFTQSFTCRTKFVPPSTVHRDLNFQKLFVRPPVKSTENIETNSDGKRRFLSKNLPRSLFLSSALIGLTYLGLANAAPPGFKRIPIQFIAALGDPKSNSGTNVNEWGLWPVDPGPRGVYLRDYERSLAKKKDGKAPAVSYYCCHFKYYMLLLLLLLSLAYLLHKCIYYYCYYYCDCKYYYCGCHIFNIYLLYYIILYYIRVGPLIRIIGGSRNMV